MQKTWQSVLQKFTEFQKTCNLKMKWGNLFFQQQPSMITDCLVGIALRKHVKTLQLSRFRQTNKPTESEATSENLVKNTT